MAGKRAEAKVYVLGDARGFHTTMRRAQWDAMTFAGKMKAIGGQMRTTGRSLARHVSLPLAAVGVVSLKLAADFESSATKIAALAGAGAKEVKFLRKEVLALAPAVGIGPQELMDALYPIESMGLRGAKAMAVLNASSKAAASGLGDLTTVSDAVTSALNAYQGTGLTAAHAVDVMVASVKAGKMKAEDFAGSLGNVLPLASKLGVGFDQVGAAIASMSRMGADPHAAGAGLTQMLTNLLKPTSQGTKTLEELGLSYAGLRKEIAGKGLMPAMMHLSEALGGNAEAAATILSKKGLTTFFTLTGKAAKTNEKVFRDVADSAGLLNEAFETTREDAGFKLKQAFVALKAAAIEIGAALMPIAVGIAKTIARVARAFGSLSPGMKKFLVIVGLIAAAAGPLLMMFGSLISLIGALAATVTVAGTSMTLFGAIMSVALGPVGLVILAVIAAAAAFVVLYKKSETFRKIVHGVAGVLKGIVVGAFKVVGAVIGWVLKHWRGLLDAFLLAAGPIGWIAMYVIHHFDTVKKALGAAWAWLQDRWDDLWNWFKKTPMGVIFGKVVDAAGAMKDAVLDHWDGLKRGIAGVVNKIGGFINKAFGWTGIHVPSVNWGGTTTGTGGGGGRKHAQGAIVRRPEVALIGEEGPELILPLTKPKRMKELLDQVGLHAYAQGGIIGDVKDALSGAWRKVKDVAGAVYAVGGNIRKWLLDRLDLPEMPDFLHNLFPSIVKALAGKIKEALGSFKRSLAGTDFGNLSGDLKSLVRQMSQRLGWDPVAWMKIIMRESGGSMTATNPSSGAYGIAQGITGPKWYYQHGGNPNTMAGQLTAMANYIRDRYDNPTNAWNFWQKHHWYGAGGSFIAHEPQLIGVGDRGPEHVQITPLGASAELPRTINVNVVLPGGTTLIGEADRVGQILAPHVVRALERSARQGTRGRA